MAYAPFPLIELSGSPRDRGRTADGTGQKQAAE